MRGGRKLRGRNEIEKDLGICGVGGQAGRVSGRTPMANAVEG